MTFDFEYNRLVVSDIYNPCALARSHQDTWSSNWETFQQWLRVLVCTVFGPHYAEYADFSIVRQTSHKRLDELIFAVRHTELAVNFLLCDLFCGRFLNGYLLRHDDPSKSSV
ncbi:hypothetical protein D3C78_1137330 [compost metagenome]